VVEVRSSKGVTKICLSDGEFVELIKILRGMGFTINVSVEESLLKDNIIALWMRAEKTYTLPNMVAKIVVMADTYTEDYAVYVGFRGERDEMYTWIQVVKVRNPSLDLAVGIVKWIEEHLDEIIKEPEMPKREEVVETVRALRELGFEKQGFMYFKFIGNHIVYVRYPEWIGGRLVFSAGISYLPADHLVEVARGLENLLSKLPSQAGRAPA